MMDDYHDYYHWIIGLDIGWIQGYWGGPKRKGTPRLTPLSLQGEDSSPREDPLGAEPGDTTVAALLSPR